MNDDMSSQSDDDSVVPNDDQTVPTEQPTSVEPPTGSMPVPQDLTNAGSDVADVETDSPETLDEAISQGDDINNEPTDPASTDDAL